MVKHTMNIKFEDGIKSIHSQYDPEYEAKLILEKYNGIENYDYILFFGVGMGYLVTEVLKSYPSKKVYLYEPNEEIFLSYLENSNLPYKNLVNFCYGDDESRLVTFLQDVLENTKRRVLIIEMPISVKLFKDAYSDFTSLFQKMVRGKRVGMHARLEFQKRWTFNSMANFGEVLDSPNILLCDREAFKGKPAILVAAGPSLNDEIENLRKIKESGMAYIFTVGTAINTLILNDIYPDAACTYDPSKENQIVFQKIVEKGISDIALIFGSSAGYESVRSYPGKKIHMITSQDTVSSYFF